MIRNDLTNAFKHLRENLPGLNEPYQGGWITVKDRRQSTVPLYRMHINIFRKTNVWKGQSNGLPYWGTYHALILTMGRTWEAHGMARIHNAFPDLFFEPLNWLRVIPSAGIPVIDLTALEEPDAYDSSRIKNEWTSRKLAFPDERTEVSFRHIFQEKPGFLDMLWQGCHLVTTHDLLFIIDKDGEWASYAMALLIKVELQMMKIKRRVVFWNLDGHRIQQGIQKNKKMFDLVVQDIEKRLGVEDFDWNSPILVEDLGVQDLGNNMDSDTPPA